MTNMTTKDTQALAAIAERHAKDKAGGTAETNWQLWSSQLRVADVDVLLQAVADRDATIARREANLVAEMRRVDELQAEVAHLTAERDEAAAEAARRERERIADAAQEIAEEAIDWAAHFVENFESTPLYDSSGTLGEHLSLIADHIGGYAFDIRAAADAIAAGEESTA